MISIDQPTDARQVPSAPTLWENLNWLPTTIAASRAIGPAFQTSHSGSSCRDPRTPGVDRPERRPGIRCVSPPRPVEPAARPVNASCSPPSRGIQIRYGGEAIDLSPFAASASSCSRPSAPRSIPMPPPSVRALTLAAFGLVGLYLTPAARAEPDLARRSGSSPPPTSSPRRRPPRARATSPSSRG